MISGVSGGLGQYFGVDPVIFRVLFAVLSFFGGVGLLAYGLAWVLIPEPDVDRSLLDKALHELRVRKVPPWLVIIGGAVVVWLGGSPGGRRAPCRRCCCSPRWLLVLIRRLRTRPLPTAGNPSGWTPFTPPAGAAMPAGSSGTIPDGPVRTGVAGALRPVRPLRCCGRPARPPLVARPSRAAGQPPWRARHHCAAW